MFLFLHPTKMINKAPEQHAKSWRAKSTPKNQDLGLRASKVPLSSGHTSLQHCWSKNCPILACLTPKRSAGQRDTPVSHHRGATLEKKPRRRQGKSWRTERDGGGAKLLPLTRPSRALGRFRGRRRPLTELTWAGETLGRGSRAKIPMSKHVGETGRV